MATISEDYVSFGIAKLLKEKGFNGEVHAWYNYFSTSTVEFDLGEVPDAMTPAPTLQMAMKWLREKYNFYISIQPDFPSDKDYKMCWCSSVSTLHENCISTKWYQCYIETYEESCEAAIKWCLDNLI